MDINRHYSWLLPLVLILLITPFTPQIDLAIEHYFFVGGHFQSNGFLDFVYTFAVIPGWIIAIGSLLIFILSYQVPYYKPWRYYALLPLLTMIFGAGLIVDKTLKDHWGRPRPKQIEEFGGLQEFRPFYKPNIFHQPEPSKSFPSGHCTMGFLFFSVALVVQRLGKRRLYLLMMAWTFVLGSLLGYTRMAQGGHYFSDVIFAAAIMWWTALFFNWFIFQKQELKAGTINETSHEKAA